MVDTGPPVRLAFPQPGGFLERWEGIVFDPTGEVMAARGWSYAGGIEDFTAPPRIKRLFGGLLLKCEHLEGKWYLCAFF
jgi:hypothetical protein